MISVDFTFHDSVHDQHSKLYHHCVFQLDSVNSNYDIGICIIPKERNREELVKRAFKKSFDELINRLLLQEDHRKVSNINLEEIKKLISYYQIINSDMKNDNQLVSQVKSSLTRLFLKQLAQILQYTY